MSETDKAGTTEAGAGDIPFRSVRSDGPAYQVRSDDGDVFAVWVQWEQGSWCWFSTGFGWRGGFASAADALADWAADVHPATVRAHSLGPVTYLPAVR